MKWLDTKAYGFEIAPYNLNDGRLALILVGHNAIANSPFADAFKSLHFTLTQKKIWFSAHYSTDDGQVKGLKVSDFRRFFPDLVIREMTIDEMKAPLTRLNEMMMLNEGITPVVSTPTETPEPTNAKQITTTSDVITDLSQAIFLGINIDGHEVYADPAGRVIKTNAGDRIFEGTDPEFVGYKYLRLVNHDEKVDYINVKNCADAFVSAAKTGSVLTTEHQENYIEILTKDLNGKIDLPSLKLNLRGAIGFAFNRMAFTEAVKNGLTANNMQRVSAVFDRRPLTQGSIVENDLHPAFAMLASRFVAQHHRNILLAGTTNGSAALALANADMSSLRIKATYTDNKYTQNVDYELKQLLNNEKIGASILSFNNRQPSHSADFILGGFKDDRSLNATSLFGVNIHRADHFHVMDTLNTLRETGIAIISCDADEDVDNGAVINSTPFLDWVYNNFNVVSGFDVAQAVVTGKTGPASRYLVINGRRLETEQILAPVEFPVCHSLPAMLSALGKAQIKIYDIDTYDALIQSQDNSFEDVLGMMKDTQEEIVINEFQARYIPMAKVGDAKSLIPINMQYPQQQAFLRYKSDAINTHQVEVNGELILRSVEIEDSLAKDLQMTRDQVIRVFNPEQRDALALAIWRFKNNKDMIIGDFTGVGKGRVLAGLSRYGAINEIPVIFLTASTDLMNDMWRDITDIESDRLIKPYIINQDAAILDFKTRDVLFTGNAKRNKELFASRRWPGESNMMFCTYSQINRPSEKALRRKYGRHLSRKEMEKISPRANYLVAMSERAMLIPDESHEATGQVSNIGLNAQIMTDASRFNFFSSGTFANNEKKLKLYRGLFPSTIHVSEMENVLTKGGQPLQEIMSAMLTADGGLICRAHDLSTLDKGIRISPNRNQNQQLNDRFAAVMMAFNKFNSIVDIKRNTYNEALTQAQVNANLSQQKINAASSKVGRSHKVSGMRRMGILGTGFGSILHNICKQFVLSVNALDAVDAAVDAIKEQRKPLIYTSQTGESLLKQIMMNAETEEDAALYDLSKFGRMPLFKDALHRMVDNSMSLTEVDEHGVFRRIELSKLFENPLEALNFESALNEVRTLIEEFGDLPFSPLDTVRLGLMKQGYVVGEASGRTNYVNEVGNGYEYANRKTTDLRLKNGMMIPATNVTLNIDAFNSGNIDVLMITNTASTGYSMHSSIRFKDQNKRELILIETPDNVIKLVQVLGRVWRNDQVNVPRVSFMSPGIPAEYRITASINYQLSKMSAQTTANRNSFAQFEDTVDILNPIGDVICKRYLESNPKLIPLLGFSKDDLGESGKDGEVTKSSIDSLSRRFTARLVVLSTKEQEQIYKILNSMYRNELRELDIKGLSPMKGNRLDWRVQELKRELVMGEEKMNYASEFDKPVYLSEILYQKKLAVIDSEELSTLIENAMMNIMGDIRLMNADIDNPLQPIAELLKQKKDDLIAEVAEQEYMFKGSYRKATPTELQEIIDISLKDYSTLTAIEKPMFSRWIRDTNDKLDWLIQVCEVMTPGSIFNEKDFAGNPKYTGVITKIVLPTSGHEHVLDEWYLESTIPGEPIQHKSLISWYMNNNEITFDRFSNESEIYSKFNSIQKGQTVPERRLILTGNMFAAAEFCTRLRSGKAVSYSDSTGNYHQGMLMPVDYPKSKLLSQPIPLFSASDFCQYINSTNSTTATGTKIVPSKTVVVEPLIKKPCFNVYVPKDCEYEIDRMRLLSISDKNEVKDFTTYSKYQIQKDMVRELADILYQDKDIRFYTDEDGLMWKQAEDRKKIIARSMTA